MGRPRTITHETELAMKSLYEQGYSTQEIGTELGITASGARICLLRNGWKLRTRHEAQSIAQPRSAKANYGKTKLGKLGNDKLEQIAQRYVAGESSIELAKEFGITGATLIKGISKLCTIRKDTEASGLKTRTDHFDQNFFENIDTPEKAYWLGFLWADGHISEYYVSLELADKDTEHLLKFRSAVGSNCSVGSGKGTKRVMLSSLKMVNFLKSLNFSNRKTYDSKNVPDIPTQFRPHFWRGCIDGDGWFPAKEPEVCLCGSEQTIVSFLEWVNSFVACSNKLYKHPNAHCWKVHITGRSRARRVIQELGYLDDRNVALERKRNICKYL